MHEQSQCDTKHKPGKYMDAEFQVTILVFAEGIMIPENRWITI